MTDNEIASALEKCGDYLIKPITGKWQCMFRNKEGRVILTTDSVVSPARALFNCQRAMYNQLFLTCNVIKENLL